jgi:IS1 family transposase
MANNLSTEKKTQIISMLAEDSSIRAIERITGVHRDTIMRLGVRVGEACKKLHDEKMRNLSATQIEVDELWGFIGKKAKNVKSGDRNTGKGDVWTFIGIDVASKVIPSYLVGKRDSYHANTFMADLASRLTMRPQITTDALGAYPEAVEKAFGSESDYAQLVKTYSISHLGNFKEAATRYSPAEVVKTEKVRIQGNPLEALVSTSRVEKQNHTVRMHVRRLTRLTNAFIKKLENFEAAMSLHFAYYNFCKVHLAVRMTPAMAAGIEKSIWTVAELLQRCGE